MDRLIAQALMLALVAPAAQALAQSAEEIEVLPDFMLRRILVDPYEEASNRLVDEGKIERGVLEAAKKWSGDEPIRVCFFGGAPDLRRRIVSVASAWELPGTRVKFDFGDRNNGLPRLANLPDSKLLYLRGSPAARRSRRLGQVRCAWRHDDVILQPLADVLVAPEKALISWEPAARR